jgi:hypothetical protein
MIDLAHVESMINSMRLPMTRASVSVSVSSSGQFGREW